MKTMPLPNAFAETLRETLDEWPFYEVTGELIEALGDLGIPAADVELLEADEMSFDRALEGLKAVLDELG